MHLFGFAQTVPDPVLNITQLGVAGLMGALWWWERRYSRQREDQLTEAHRTILAEREHLMAVITALQENTRAIATFTVSHEQLVLLLRELHDRTFIKAA